MVGCEYCVWAAGASNPRRVYEDEWCVAVVEGRPARVGHVVLFPKKHHSIGPQLGDELVRHLGAAAQRISRALIIALKVHGTTVLISNGVAAGQREQHFIMDIIPRDEGDGLSFSKEGVELAERERVKEAISARVKELFHG